MQLIHTFYLMKTDGGMVCNTSPYDEDIHQLKIETFIDATVGDKTIPRVQYKLHDSRATKDLDAIHVILSCNYSSINLGDKFRMETSPVAIKNDYTKILIFHPIDVVEAIEIAEKKFIKEYNLPPIFSISPNSDIQYHGLIRELARKCKK